jgi:hypothetical protein
MTDTMTSQNIDLSSWNTLYRLTHLHKYTHTMLLVISMIHYIDSNVILGILFRYKINGIILKKDFPFNEHIRHLCYKDESAMMWWENITAYSEKHIK